MSFPRYVKGHSRVFSQDQLKATGLGPPEDANQSDKSKWVRGNGCICGPCCLPYVLEFPGWSDSNAEFCHELRVTHACCCQTENGEGCGPPLDQETNAKNGPC